MSKNHIKGAEAGKALGDALAGNTVLKELDLSGENWIYHNMDLGFVKAFTPGLSDNGALYSLDLSHNSLGHAVGVEVLTKMLEKGSLFCEDGNCFKSKGKGMLTQSTCRHCGKKRSAHGKGALSVLSLKGNRLATKEAGRALANVLAANSVLKELDLSSNAWEFNPLTANADGPGFAQELAHGIKDNRAISSLHVGCNQIPEKEMREIMAIAMSKESMKVLCEVPFKDKTITALDVSGKMLGVEGALVVAEYLDGNEALSVLSLKNNALGTKEAGKVLGEMLKENYVLKELDLSNNKYFSDGWKTDPEFAQELAAGIKDNGALSCGNGRYYHDWYLNKEYQAVDEVLVENKEEILARFKEIEKLEGEEKQEVLQQMGQDSMPTEKQFLDIVKPMIEAQIKEAGVFKYVSVAPDVDGQNEDPGVPLDTGNCLCCKKPKGQHAGNGALIKLDISDNRIGAEQEKGLQRICVASGIKLAT
jgi:hypothetical protein